MITQPVPAQRSEVRPGGRMEWLRVGIEVVLGIGLFLVGRWFGRRDRHEDRLAENRQRLEDASSARIEGVVAEYSRLAHGHPRQKANLPGFVTAGAKALTDDAELREAVRRIVERFGAGYHPLGRERDQLLALPDLHAFMADLEGPALRNYDEVCQRYGITRT